MQSYNTYKRVRIAQGYLRKREKMNGFCDRNVLHLEDTVW